MGPGTRVPTIIVSPYAKRGFVDHTTYDTTSILKLIEERWGLDPLGTRDAAAKDLTNAFDFTLPVSAFAVPALPQTGDDAPAILGVVTGSALLLIVAGVWLRRKRSGAT